MMNFTDNYLWIILLVCCCGNNLCDILPLLLILECGCGGGMGGKLFGHGHGGCGCKQAVCPSQEGLFCSKNAQPEGRARCARGYAPFSLWSVESAIIDSVQVISATEALDIARVRLENTRGYAKGVINKISGEYAYVADGDHFVLRPVWVVYAQFTSAYNDVTTQQYVIIDAVTGDELMQLTQ